MIEPVRVLLLEDEELVRISIKMILESSGRIEVVYVVQQENLRAVGSDDSGRGQLLRPRLCIDVAAHRDHRCSSA